MTILNNIFFLAIGIPPFFTALIGLTIAALLAYLLGKRMSAGTGKDWEQLFTDKNAAYDKVNSSYKSLKSKHKKLEEKFSDASASTKPLTKEITTLKSSIANFESIIAEKDLLITEAKEASADLGAVTASEAVVEELHGLKVKLLDKDKQIEDLNRTIRTSSTSDLSDKISEMERKITIANKSNANLTSQIDEWRNKYDNVSPELKKQMSDNGDLKIKMHSKDAIIKELREKLANITPDVSTGDELRKIKEQLAQSEEKGKSLLDQISKLKVGAAAASAASAAASFIKDKTDEA